MILTCILLLIGFILLIKGADILVDGACDIASFMGVPTMIIGLTVVAFGTSAPELSVSVSAALHGSNEIALGNVVGSNLVNLLFIAGLSAVILPFQVKPVMLKRDYPFSVIASIALLIISVNDGKISTKEGIVLLLMFAVFMCTQAADSFKNNSDNTEKEKPAVLRGLLFTAIGLAAVVFGGHIVVDNSVVIAKTFGLSEAFIGLTIVAIGTSLPELVTSVVAAGKGESDLAIGNVVGSNLFNIMLIIGVSAVITPIPVESAMINDMVILAAVSIIFFIPMLIKKKVSRLNGAVMALTYFAYTAYLFLK